MLVQKNGCVHESFLKLESLWVIPSLRSKLTILQIGGDNLAFNVNKQTENINLKCQMLGLIYAREWVYEITLHRKAVTHLKSKVPIPTSSLNFLIKVVASLLRLVVPQQETKSVSFYK